MQSLDCLVLLLLNFLLLLFQYFTTDALVDLALPLTCFAPCFCGLFSSAKNEIMNMFFVRVKSILRAYPNAATISKNTTNLRRESDKKPWTPLAKTS